jgi:phage tail tape-measure protein
MKAYQHQEKLLASILLINLCLGCSTTGKSVGAGATIGGLAGGTAGALADPGPGGSNRFRNVLIGTAIGGALGTGAGLLVDSAVKDDKKDSYEKGKKDAEHDFQVRSQATSGNEPKLIPPKTEARWIGDQVHGSTFVPGHFEYVILENSHWEPAR